MAVINGIDFDNAALSCCLGGGGTVNKLATPVIVFTGISSTGFTADWGDIANSDSYDIDIATDSNFTTIVDSDTGLTASQYATTGRTAATTYYVRVIARDSTATYLDSDYGYNNQATSAGIQAPNLNVLRSAVGTLATFSSPSGAVSVTIERSLSSSFTSPTANTVTLPATQLETAGGLTSGTTYYYRIRATDASSNVSAWSATVTVTTFNTILSVGGTTAAGGVTLSGAPGLEVHFDVIGSPTSPNASQDDYIIGGSNVGNTAFPDDYAVPTQMDKAVVFGGQTYYGSNSTTQYKFVQGAPATITIS